MIGVAQHAHPAGWPCMETLTQESPASAAHVPAEQPACASSSAEVWALSWYVALHMMPAQLEGGAGSGLWRAGASCGLLLLERDTHPFSPSLQNTSREVRKQAEKIQRCRKTSPLNVNDCTLNARAVEQRQLPILLLPMSMTTLAAQRCSCQAQSMSGVPRRDEGWGKTWSWSCKMRQRAKCQEWGGMTGNRLSSTQGTGWGGVKMYSSIRLTCGSCSLRGGNCHLAVCG